MPEFAYTPKDEIPIEHLLDILANVDGAFDIHKVGHGIQYLKRAGLISFNWQQKTIKREKAIKEYVTKQVTTSEFWPKIAGDWRRIYGIIQDKYHKVNPEYEVITLSTNS